MINYVYMNMKVSDICKVEEEESLYASTMQIITDVHCEFKGLH